MNIIFLFFKLEFSILLIITKIRLRQFLYSQETVFYEVVENFSAKFFILGLNILGREDSDCLIFYSIHVSEIKKIGDLGLVPVFYPVVFVAVRQVSKRLVKTGFGAKIYDLFRVKILRFDLEDDFQLIDIKIRDYLFQGRHAA